MDETSITLPALNEPEAARRERHHEICSEVLRRADPAQLARIFAYDMIEISPVDDDLVSRTVSSFQ